MTSGDRASTVAYSLVALGLAGTTLDNNGTVGLVLFAAAAAAVVFLGARLITRPGLAPAPALIGARAAGVTAMFAGALLVTSNAFEPTDATAVSRFLNDATFIGGAFLVAGLAVVAVGTVTRRLVVGTRA